VLHKATPERVSAFSDGVFAVLITVLVLELRPPELPTYKALLSLWPSWLSYAVSYLFIAIVWTNHHYLIAMPRRRPLVSCGSTSPVSHASHDHEVVAYDTKARADCDSHVRFGSSVDGRFGENFLTRLQHWSGAVMCPTCLCGW